MPLSRRDSACLSIAVLVLVCGCALIETDPRARPGSSSATAEQARRPADPGRRLALTDLDAPTRTAILDALRRARPDDRGAGLAFANAEHQLGATVHATGTTIRGRSSAVTFSMPRLGRPGALTTLTEGVTTGAGTTEVTIARRAGPIPVTEWWRNTPAGVEQGFTITNRPDGEGALELVQTWTTDLDLALTADGRTVTFSREGQEHLRYAGLAAWDADGQRLPARLAASATARTLTFVVDDASAAYPVTIDPVWSQQAYLKASNTGADDDFGSAIAISGDTIVVGASSEDSNATGVNGNQTDDSATESGAAYVFVRTGTTWVQQAYLKASDTAADDFFGISVAIDGDTIVVGADARGAAYVFHRSGSTWAQQALLQAITGTGDSFGGAVAISGNTIVVGAPSDDSAATGVNGNPFDDSVFLAGAAYVFRRTGTTWSQEAYLKASNTGDSDAFGSGVSISGDTVAVSAIGEDSAATGVNGNQNSDAASASGAVYVFTRSGSSWTQQAYVKASNTDAGDDFGHVLALSGDTLVVGAPSERSNATGVNGNQADDSAADAGAAYVFTRSGLTWSQQAYLKASNTAAGSLFGIAVSASGDTVVVGAPVEDSGATGVNGNQADVSATSSGAAYVFDRVGTTWTQRAYLKASNTGATDFFGEFLALSGDTLAVGARFEASAATGVNGNQADETAPFAGAAYVFHLAGPDALTNGSFTSGTNGWSTFALPTPADMTFNVTSGVFQFNRAGTQAVVLQSSGVGAAANTGLTAEFRLGNTDSVRKRISVLIHDADFSDLHVCTFWLPANAPLRLYRINTHTTKAWTNATMSFYAATVGVGGFYQLDDVSFVIGPGSTTSTTCVDPWTPGTAGGAAGPELVVNGNFSAGLAPWTTFGQITGAVTGGVFEFIRTPGTPAGVVLQATGQAIGAANQTLSATFRLGNSSAVRKRVTVILHDNSFGDLAACTFWLAPGQSLSTYTMRTYTTLPWTNATVSVYPATVGAEQWIRLDTVSLRRTPAATISGTVCVEPGGSGDAEPRLDSSPSPVARVQSAASDVDEWFSDGFLSLDADGRAWIARVDPTRTRELERADAFDLTTASTARLTLESWVVGAALGRVEVTRDEGAHWDPVLIVPPTDSWTSLSADLSAFLGNVVRVRFVLDRGDDPDRAGWWLLADVTVDMDH